MTNNLMHVRGTIVAANPEAVNENTGHRIMTEMIRNRLVATLSDPNSGSLNWNKGTITPDSHTETLGGRPAALDFITRLYAVITSPGVKAIGLRGELIVTVGAVKEPVVFRITVENDNVFYNEGKIVWNDEPFAFM